MFQCDTWIFSALVVNKKEQTQIKNKLNGSSKVKLFVIGKKSTIY